MVVFWRTGDPQKTENFVTFSPLGVAWGGPGGGGGRGTPDPPWDAPAQPGQNDLGGHLVTPNGAVKVRPKAGH